ncbi:flavodoxin family protein [Clostridium sp. DJ247]|uniref:flavodoxin family protein n=1 Tax=Clostridium sp. DJ247 TaxID=2726188 RepID=UPI001623A345|nr:flavodoxin family protein [Clostridium sp. DJ247]MBC2579576.1 flavodoxin family protein [Clostridium sp. DJ247]
MKILGIMGSPRAKGNTATLLEQVLEGAKEKGADTNMVSLNNLDIKGCINCDVCKRSGKCVLKDDMHKIYDMINDADIVVFGSPNYMGGIQGKLKCVLDRLYAYIIAEEGGFSVTFDKKKKAALIVTQRAPEENASYTEAFTPLRYILSNIFEGSFDAPCKLLLGGELYKPNDAANNKELMKKAYKMGMELVEEF